MAVRTMAGPERVMARNDEIAADIRRRLEAAGVVALNMVSAPGAGKTLLLERTLLALAEDLDIAVVAGGVETPHDADRLAQHTTRPVQAVVTHGACHLDARQIAEALDHIDLDATRLLLIENIGDLVCPAAWDLGETATVVVFSVTEGEDLPLKYPAMFRRARWVVVHKVDLLRHLAFDTTAALANVKSVNPGLEVFFTSALSGTGLDEWYRFLRGLVHVPQPA